MASSTEDEKVQHEPADSDQRSLKGADSRAADPKSSESTLHSVVPAELEQPLATVDLRFLPIPKHLQYYKSRPPAFTLALNILFGVGSTFAVANLYYSQPLLIQLSRSFHVSYDEVSRIPTLTQAGYAGGLLLITPLGDLVRRRPLILLLSVLGAALTIGLPITSSVTVFEVLSLLVGFTSVVPQIMMPFAADLAPPERRASAIAIVLSGLLLGVMFARVLAGVVANFVTWRVVYWLALGLQAGTTLLFYFMLPDFPAKNPDLTYVGILYTMAKFAVTEPLLIQGALINVAGSACFTNFWVTLTFLLGGPIYNYSTVVIGLFGLVGMCGVAMSPFIGRLLDKMELWWATLIASTVCLAVYALQTAAAGVTVAAVVIVTVGMDIFRQTQQVSISTRVLGLDPLARSRLNAVLIIAIFIGQIMGTAVGTTVYNHHGWRAAAALNLGWQGFCVLVLLARGPRCPRYTWVGYKGGLGLLRRERPPTPPSPGDKEKGDVAQEEKEKDIDEKTIETIAEGGNVVTATSPDDTAVVEEPRTGKLSQ